MRTTASAKKTVWKKKIKVPDKQPLKQLQKLEEKEKETRSRVFVLLRLLRRARNPRLLATAVLYAAICALLLPRFFGGATYKPGDIADADIVSPGIIEYTDSIATDIQKNKAANAAGTVFRLLPSFQKDIESIFRQALEYQESDRDEETKRKITGNLIDYGLSGQTVQTLLSLNKDKPIQLRLKTYAVMDKISKDRLLDERELMRIDDDAARYAREEEIETSLIPAVQEIIRVAIRLNLETDLEATEYRQQQAKDAVNPVTRRIREKEIIVRKGDAITERHLDIMRQAGLLSTGMPWVKPLAYMLLLLFAFFVIAVFLKTFVLNIYRDEKRLLIFYLIILLAVLWAVMIDQSPIFSKYLIGVSAGMMTILVCLLLNPMTALFSVPVMILVISVIQGLEMGHFLVALFAFMAAYFHSVRTQDKDSLLKAGAAVGVSSMSVILVLTLVRFPGLRQAMTDIVLFGGLNGLFSFVLANGLLPAFEKLFSVTTPHRLLELSNPEEPLLKRLLIDAPGTYHHSILVGNIAEAAAEAVGADALLVRIACYYHDVGKLKRPYFFIENQMHGDSRLNEVAPTLAALVIASHVKDGVEMAQESGVPDEVVEIISEHHGSCLISFFYQQAQAEAKDAAGLQEQRFRYPGPKPSRIESAILMLADSCEAAVRSQKAPTPKSIESTVNSIFEARLMDGQFNGCNVTLKQLGAIQMTIIKTLARVYHSRMEYPDIEELKQHKDHVSGRNGDK